MQARSSRRDAGVYHAEIVIATEWECLHPPVGVHESVVQGLLLVQTRGVCTHVPPEQEHVVQRLLSLLC
jgi:hypothetical protein